jgi:hypothetical protein
MYSLTLSRSERQAIDWVGYRYGHGDDLFRLLASLEWGEQEWDQLEPMTFNVDEPTAWAIAEIREECEGRWDCFASPLVEKMEEFCGRIV